MNSGSISTRLQKVTAAVGVATMLFMVTSCSTGTAQVAPSPDSSSSASASPSSTPTTPAVSKPGDVINGIPTKAELANDGKGDYIQTTISDDDPAMIFNPDLSIGTVPGLYTDADTAEAQKVIMRFIAEEGIDSTLNNNSLDLATIDAWWAKNKDRINPANHDEFYSSLVKPDFFYAFVMRTQHRTAEFAYGADKTRVTARTLTPKSHWTNSDKGIDYIGFEVEARFSMALVEGETVKQENVKATFIYSVTRSSTGELVLSGYQNTFHFE